MKELTIEERKFLERIKSSSLSKSKGYWRYTHKKKHYTRSRVLVQLYLNKKLEIWEIVHHKNGNRENDTIENLEIKDLDLHTSFHIAGLRNRKYKKRRISNKIDDKTIDKIFELAKIYKYGKKPSFSRIGKELGISGFTAKQYYIKKIKQF